MESSEDAGADHVALLSDHRALSSVSGWRDLPRLVLLVPVPVAVVVVVAQDRGNLICHSVALSGPGRR